jgi:hypothetical protein
MLRPIPLVGRECPQLHSLIRIRGNLDEQFSRWEVIMSLTGRFNFKKTWRGKLNLVVEEEYRSRWGVDKRRWRTATLADLAEPQMRTLIDLRFQRKFRPVAAPASAPVSDAALSSPSVIPFPNNALVPQQNASL